MTVTSVRLATGMIVLLLFVVVGLCAVYTGPIFAKESAGSAGAATGVPEIPRPDFGDPEVVKGSLRGPCCFRSMDPSYLL